MCMSRCRLRVHLFPKVLGGTHPSSTFFGFNFSPVTHRRPQSYKRLTSEHPHMEIVLRSLGNIERKMQLLRYLAQFLLHLRP